MEQIGIAWIEADRFLVKRDRVFWFPGIAFRGSEALVPVGPVREGLDQTFGSRNNVCPTVLCVEQANSADENPFGSRLKRACVGYQLAGALQRICGSPLADIALTLIDQDSRNPEHRENR